MGGVFEVAAGEGELAVSTRSRWTTRQAIDFTTADGGNASRTGRWGGRGCRSGCRNAPESRRGTSGTLASGSCRRILRPAAMATGNAGKAPPPFRLAGPRAPWKRSAAVVRVTDCLPAQPGTIRPWSQLVRHDFPQSLPCLWQPRLPQPPPPCLRRPPEPPRHPRRRGSRRRGAGVDPRSRSRAALARRRRPPAAPATENPPAGCHPTSATPTPRPWIQDQT